MPIQAVDDRRLYRQIAAMTRHDKLDAFVGMLAERHVARTEFGPLQLAMWKQQFEAVRDGDRFFYLNDPVLPAIASTYGIDYRRTLTDIIRLDTGTRVQAKRLQSPQRTLTVLTAVR